MYCNAGKQHIVRTGSESQSDQFSLSRCFLFFGTVTFLNRGWNPEPDSTSVRIVFFSGLAAGAIIYYYWEASIISFLAVRTIALPFDSLKDLLENTDTKVRSL